MNAIEKVKAIKSGKLSAEKNVRGFLERIKKENKKYNAVLVVNSDAIAEARAIDKKKSKGRLAGLGFIVKSNICVSGLETNCASLTLKGWKASYDASVISKIKKEDGIILGMANMDEFASGASGETSAFGAAKNPVDSKLIAGGSSSGSAVSVALEFCDVALGSDTGGSIRNPASHTGVVGVKPSYGLVSRYGLIDLSMSLDQIGPLSKDVGTSELVLDVISGRDERDPTTFGENVISPPIVQGKISSRNFKSQTKAKLVVGLLRGEGETFDLVEKRVREVASQKGWKVKEIDIKYTELAVQTYYPIVYTEFYSGTRKFDGRKFGKKIEDVAGPEVVRRLIGGSEISRAEYGGRYYKKALEVKDLIGKEFDSVFDKVDVVISPTVPRLPHKIGSAISAKEMYSYDSLTIPANLAGICGVSVPGLKIDGVPVGLQVMANRFEESKMFSVAKGFEVK